MRSTAGFGVQSRNRSVGPLVVAMLHPVFKKQFSSNRKRKKRSNPNIKSMFHLFVKVISIARIEIDYQLGRC